MTLYKKDITLDEILTALNGLGANEDVKALVGQSFLNNKLQQQLLNEQKDQQKAMLDKQNEYNRKQLYWSRLLTFGTWALVVATLLLLRYRG